MSVIILSIQFIALVRKMAGKKAFCIHRAVEKLKWHPEIHSMYILKKEIIINK